MELQIAKAHQIDAHPLAEILNEANDYKAAHGDDAWGSGHYTDEEVGQSLKTDTVYTAYLGDEIIGTVMLQWEDPGVWGDQPPDAGYLHRLAIKDGFHGQDMGGQIIRWAMGETAKNNRHYLRLDCPADNASLCSYYESKGFRRIATKPNPFHEGRTTAFYELNLADDISG